jgi:uncharacterized protein (TIGR02594 family)
MALYTITQRTPFFKAANMASPLLGIANAGTEIEGTEENGFIKTRIDAVAVGEGFVAFQAALERPSVPQPILPDSVGFFIALVTRMARDLETDRDYLLAVAYAGTTNLRELGGANDARIGPFKYTAQEWSDAITAGPARGKGFTAEDRYRWSSQAEVAARLTADAFKRFADAVGHPPTFVELYFAQLYGDGAFALLKGDPNAKCRDVIAGAPPDSFAAKLAAGQDTIGEALQRLKSDLLAAYLVVSVEIDKQPPEIRFFRPGEGEPPWVTVARAEMTRGVSETPERKNSDDIKVYLRTTNLPDLAGTTPWCGAFLAFCMKTCGIKEVEDSVKPGAAAASWWENWGQAAVAPYPLGTVVVLRAADGSAGHVGLIVGSDGNDLQVLGGNQGGAEGPAKVSVVRFPVGQILATRIMAVPIPAPVAGVNIDVKALVRVGATAQPADADFVGKAPGIMRDLVRDLPGLTATQAGGILGNIGHECMGFRELHQLGMPDGQGGYGWAQWDGARRTAFLKWAADHVLEWRSDKANYTYLVNELQTTEGHAFNELKRQTSLEAAVINFDQFFERSGVKALDSRLRYARLAMIAFGG